jgi:hypothetical protein
VPSVEKARGHAQATQPDRPGVLLTLRPDDQRAFSFDPSSLRRTLWCRCQPAVEALVDLRVLEQRDLVCPPAEGKCALVGPAVDPVAIKAGVRAGSRAAAVTVAADGNPGLSSPHVQWGRRRDRQLAGTANRDMDAPATAGLATGSRSMDPASDKTDGGAAATLTLPGRSRLSGARRHHPHGAHPHSVAKPFPLAQPLASSGGGARRVSSARCQSHIPCWRCCTSARRTDG